MSTPKFAATLVIGKVSRGGIWHTPGERRCLDDLDLTFRAKFNEVRFNHDGITHIIDQFGRVAA